MCEDCRGTHKHYHWLTFTSYAALEEHLRLLTHRDDQIQSIITWWQDTRSLYKDTVSEITGAPLSVAEAWRDAQWRAREQHYGIADARDEARVIAEYWQTHDAEASDADVMRTALREINAALDGWGALPEVPTKHSAAEIRRYVEEGA